MKGEEKMPQIYNEEFREKIVHLHIQEGRTYKSLVEEYGVSKASISKWCRDFSKECQLNPATQNNLETMKEIYQLKKQLQELEKENAFLKKQRHSLQRK